MSEAAAVVVREARRDEIGAVVELWHAAGAEPGVTDNPESVEHLLERDGGALLVADDDGRLVGTVIAGWDGWRGNLYRLAVLPSHRREGIGLALVDVAEQRLRARGAARITALVMHEHEHAMGFWRAAGYELDARITRFVRTITTPAP